MTTKPPATATPPALQFHPDFDLARADAIRTTLQRSLAGDKPVARNATTFGARALTVDGVDALEFIGVTEPVARDGDIVRVDGIRLDALSTAPVFLWSHDYRGERPPIGRIISTNRETDPTLGRIFTFRAIPALVDGVDHEHLDFVRLIWGYYKARFINSVSYGWRIVEARPLTDAQGYVTGLEHVVSEALEFSACNVGSDRHAVQRLIQEEKLPEKYIERFMGPAFRNAPAYELRETPPAGFVWRDLPAAAEVPATPAAAEPPVVAAASPSREPAAVATETPAAGVPLVVDFRVTGTDALGETLLAQLREQLPALVGELVHGRKGAVLSKRTKEMLERARGHLTECQTHAANLNASAQACLDAIGDVLASAEKPAADDEGERTVPAVVAPAVTAAPSPILDAIDGLARVLPQKRTLLDAIDDLTVPRAAPSAAQANFDQVLAAIAARGSTDPAKRAAAATR